MKNILLLLLISLSLAPVAMAQSVPLNIGVQILQAEDARDYNPTLEKLLEDKNPAVRKRAALAAGRIGDDKAVEKLTWLLQNEKDQDIRAMAAFALGEIESSKAAEAILEALRAETRAAGGVQTIPSYVLARLVEAAGKIAAANSKDPRSTELGKAILETLNAEFDKGTTRDKETVLLGLTAALRVRPEGTDVTAAKFLKDIDPRIRADAANCLARVRAKNANETLHKIVLFDPDDISRVNAIRALASAEDKDAFNLLLEAATGDKNPNVRIAAIQALARLKNTEAVGRLVERGRELLRKYHASKRKPPFEQSELLEIATTLGRIIPNNNDQHAKAFLMELRDSGWSPEADIAYALVAPSSYMRYVFDSLHVKSAQQFQMNWREVADAAQAFAEIVKTKTPEGKSPYETLDVEILKSFIPARDTRSSPIPKVDARAIPNVLQAYAALKPKDLDEKLRDSLDSNDVFTRATAAQLLAEEPTTKENVDSLTAAFERSIDTDKQYDDAQLAIMDALYKLDRKESVGTLLSALGAPDYLVRKKAFELLDNKELFTDFPGIPKILEVMRSKHKDNVLPYDLKTGTKLGQVLNTEADYRRALQRKNGTVKAVVTTDKGAFTIDLLPEDAPLTVDNFIKLANAKYFNGVEVHRVVPNFVMQDGDPRGDGNGGPGWSIRCEINMVAYERGAVGMALSGKDTGGSQWFVTHLPTPHLDGGYTVFGKVNEAGMKVIDTIVRGDKIVSIKVMENKVTSKTQRTQWK